MKRLSKLCQVMGWIVCTVEAALVFVQFVENIVNTSHHFKLGGKSLCCGVVDIEWNPPHSLVFFWFDISRGQESALTNGNLIRFLGNGDDRESNYTNPWILWSFRAGNKWQELWIHTMKALTSCLDASLRADHRSSVVAFPLIIWSAFRLWKGSI